ncbi:PH-like domain-containing protein [Rhodococcus xishaensis]|uniref:Transporter n=1 Tax=Rhodococcus xishaensis TaxID=2487364 RepID=A0A438AZD8_9NOCA|nr:transporter [Rhodococcus xishaensis]RVW04055.1 transporter [Rhodococcus xishaensis]
MERLLWIVGCVVIWALLVFLMYRGWKARAARQAARVGELPTVPADLGDPWIAQTTGLYVGSTLAPSWQDRVAVGDIGHRATGRISRWSRGVLLERDGASAIWIPDESIRAIRTERGLAGKVMTKDGLLVIRWELPTGTEIDTGFRGDDKTVYPEWVRDSDSYHTANASDSGEVEQNGEDA